MQHAQWQGWLINTHVKMSIPFQSSAPTFLEYKSVSSTASALPYCRVYFYTLLFIQHTVGKETWSKSIINCHTTKCLLQATLPTDHIQTANAFLICLSAHTYINVLFHKLHLRGGCRQHDLSLIKKESGEIQNQSAD